MKYKTLFWINIVFLIAVSCVLFHLFKNMNTQKSKQYVDRNIVQKLKNSEDYISFLPELYEVANEYVTDQPVISIENDTILLETISTNKQKVILYVSSLQCKDCVEYSLSLIDALNKKFGQENVCILYSGFTQRKMAQLKSDKTLNNSFLEILPTENQNILTDGLILRPIA